MSNFVYQILMIVAFIVTCSIGVLVTTSLRKRIKDSDLGEDSMEAKIIDFIESLFLFAEKKIALAGPEKMDLVVNMAINTYPDEIGSLEEPRGYIQDVYDNYTAEFEEYNKKAEELNSEIIEDEETADNIAEETTSEN